MAPAASFAIETAMRQGEILGLTWAGVDVQKGIAKLVDTKNGDARDVPLSRGNRDPEGAPADGLRRCNAGFPAEDGTSLIRAFRRACNAAGLVDLKFHDLRHEAVSRLFEHGLNVAEVAAISGRNRGRRD